MPADRTQILNSSVGGGRDLNAEPLAEDPKSEEVNARLHGRMAVSALAAAIEAGGATLAPDGCAVPAS